MTTTTETSQREELAREIWLADRLRACAPGGPSEQDRRAADRLLAKGYRKPRTITTVEELDALPDGSFIVTEQGGYWQADRRGHGINWWHGRTRGISASSDLTLPATVLWEPEA